MRGLLMGALGAALLSGCVVDRTGRSATYLLEDKVDGNRERVVRMQKDLALQVSRVDDMEQRAANARQRLADSGATLETFLYELQALRGEVADLSYRLDENKGSMGAVEFRLAAMEARLSHMEKELDITPPLILPPVQPEEPAPRRDGAVPPATGRTPREEPTDGAPGADAEGDAFDPDDEGEDEVVAELARPADAEILMEDAQPSEDELQFQQGLVFMKKKDWEKAGSTLQRFVKDNPTHPRAIEAQFLVGQALFELGRYKPAITQYQKAIEMDETSDFAPRAVFMQALSFEELGSADDVEAAKVFFGELIRLYPDAPDADRARRKLEALGGP